jgi:hypothetical protein
MNGWKRESNNVRLGWMFGRLCWPCFLVAIMEVPAALTADALPAERQRATSAGMAAGAGGAVFFGGFGFALVPLYDVICS